MAGFTIPTELGQSPHRGTHSGPLSLQLQMPQVAGVSDFPSSHFLTFLGVPRTSSPLVVKGQIKNLCNFTM